MHPYLRAYPLYTLWATGNIFKKKKIKKRKKTEYQFSLSKHIENFCHGTRLDVSHSQKVDNIRIYQECESGIEKMSRGSPVVITRLAE